jgi:hypothetical protein
MTDPDEIKLAKLAKSVLSMPHKKREDSKVGARGSAKNTKSGDVAALVAGGLTLEIARAANSQESIPLLRYLTAAPALAHSIG